VRAVVWISTPPGIGRLEHDARHAPPPVREVRATLLGYGHSARHRRGARAAAGVEGAGPHEGSATPDAQRDSSGNNTSTALDTGVTLRPPLELQGAAPLERATLPTEPAAQRH
jgi:hypothetical protein